MDLSVLKQRLFFGIQDVAYATGLSRPSAQVLCSRYIKNGVFLRLKRDFYVLADNWDRNGTRQLMQIGNLLQVPSYLSLTTALAYHGFTTQVQRRYVESVASRRSKTIAVRDTVFVFHKLQRRLFFGFQRKDGLFIAEPEKAFLDAAFLEILGHSALDWDAVDLARMDRCRLDAYLNAFPEPFRPAMVRKCRI